MPQAVTAEPSNSGKLRVAVLLSGRAQFSICFGGALVRWTYEIYNHLRPWVAVMVFGFPTDSATAYPMPHTTSGWSKACRVVSYIPVLRRLEDEIWLRALLKRVSQFDIVHIHNRPQWVGMLRRLGYRGTIVLHLQNDHLGHWNSDMLDALAPEVNAVVVCSTYIGNQFCPKSVAIAAKTKLISNGANIELFYPNENLREPKTIFFVGSFIPQKGALELVKAYARVLETHPDAKLVIGGSVTFGVNQETPYIRQVRELADNIRSQKGAEIQFPGSIHHDKELPSWFQRATIFTSPSLFQEPFGLVNAEAMASATPVVGSNRGGIPEVLGGAGLVVNPENTLEYAAALSRLLGDPAECRRLGQLGYQRSREMFDWRVIANTWLPFLSDLIRGRAA
jgi:spore coat protein SA